MFILKIKNYYLNIYIYIKIIINISIPNLLRNNVINKGLSSFDQKGVYSYIYIYIYIYIKELI
jgi:hypothetical protein